MVAPRHDRVVHNAADPAEIDVPRLLRALAPFRIADDTRATIELVVTAVPLVLLWVAAMMLVKSEIWLGLALTIPAGLFLLRLFMIQHDCGHGSFFRSKLLNNWVGRTLGVLTLTPYEFWKRAHARHHAGTGNLDRRGSGDIDTLTVAEYRQLSAWARLRYRMYRHPITLFGIGPAFQFLLMHRIPAGAARKSSAMWISVMGTNAAVAAVFAGLISMFGLGAFLIVHLPIVLIAATVGIWLFYIQHQFEHAVWDRNEDWSYQASALQGSSHYDLPPVLRWFSADIGVHHVHHLCSTIPYYRLEGVLRAEPRLRSVGRLTLRQSFGTIRLALWDERTRRMVSFKDAAAAA